MFRSLSHLFHFFSIFYYFTSFSINIRCILLFNFNLRNYNLNWIFNKSVILQRHFTLKWYFIFLTTWIFTINVFFVLGNVFIRNLYSHTTLRNWPRLVFVWNNINLCFCLFLALQVISWFHNHFYFSRFWFFQISWTCYQIFYFDLHIWNFISILWSSSCWSSRYRSWPKFNIRRRKTSFHRGFSNRIRFYLWNSTPF